MKKIESEFKTDVKEEGKKFVINKMNNAMEESEAEGETKALKKITKSKNINVEIMKLEEATRGKSINVGEIVIVSNDDDEKLGDLLKILKSISENKILIEYLNGQKKKLLSYY